MVVGIAGQAAVSVSGFKNALSKSNAGWNAITIHFFYSDSPESLNVIFSRVPVNKGIAANSFDWL